VVAVLTADDLKPVNLHWMPTLGGDVQAVLADKKVCFQMQEVAMVLATDRYAAADGAALVEVDYEELPAIVDPKQSMAPTRRSSARTSPTRRKSATARARTRTTSSPGKPATRQRRRGLRERRRDGARGNPEPARATRARSKPAAASRRSTRRPATSPST
jgi:CO/xanthine dehydrogenase Mo-binding subunit